MRFKFSCPGCGKSLYVSHADASSELLCQACGRRVVLPPGLGAPGELTPLPDAHAHPDEASGVEIEAGEFNDAAEANEIAADVGDDWPVLTASRDPVQYGRRPIAAPVRKASLDGKSVLVGIVGGLLLASTLFLGIHLGRAGDSAPVAEIKPPPRPEAQGREEGAMKTPTPTQPASRPAATRQILAAASAKDATKPQFVPAVQEPIVQNRPQPTSRPTEMARGPLVVLPATQVAVDVGLPPLPETPDVAEARPMAQTSADKPATTSPTTQPTAVAATQPTTMQIATVRPRLPLRMIPVGKRTPQQLDQQIDDAIRKASEYLLTNAKVEDIGHFTLAAYAAITAGQATNDPRLSLKSDQMVKLIEKLKETKYDGYHGETYSRAIRATALAQANRKEDRKALEEDVYWLVDTHRKGAYTYGPPRMQTNATTIWDNSNSQYGLLGVWAGAEVGVEVPRAYWEAVESHWENMQMPDGRWGYSTPEGPSPATTTMTCAGIASLLVTYDYLHAEEFVSRYSTLGWPRQLTRPLNWLATRDNALTIAPNEKRKFGAGEMGEPGYGCYGLERVGLATGFKYFGTHDWYLEIAEMMVDQQAASGIWGRGVQEVITTSYNVLFLARGRHPIVANKLLHKGAWSNRPRDLANVARFVSKTVERPLNWQVVNLERPGTDWLDAPILYLPSHKPIELADPDIDKVREYIDWGGLVFLHADGGSAAYIKWAEQFVPRICRGAKLVDLPSDHPLWKVAYKLSNTIKLKAVSNGSRLLVVLALEDHARVWQVREERTRSRSYELFGNLFAYATGNVPPRNRVDTTFVEPLPIRPDFALKVARLTYDGNWDPEPGAWMRLARLFAWETGLEVVVVPSSAKDLSAAKASLVHLTGTAAIKIDDAQAVSLGEYVRNGGVLLIDGCGGNTDFADSIEQKLLPTAFPGINMAMADLSLPPFAQSHEVMDDLSTRKLRPFTTTKMDRRARPMMIGQYGKGVVIYSPLDLTTGLLGTHVWGVMGHTPDYAKGVMKNILIWAGTMRPVE